MSSSSTPGNQEEALSIGAHNLNAGLRQVRCYSQLLREEAGPIELPALQHLTRIEESAERLQELVTGLFPLLRLKREHLNFEEISLTLVLRRCAIEMDDRLRENSAVFAHEPMPKVYGDRKIVTKVVQHLIDNGLKFNRSVPPKIHVSGVAKKGKLVVAVRDNGIGVELPYQKRCFAPFGRLHAEGVYPGQGLGLAFCAKAIGFHKGKMWMESEPGEGTIVRFTLPLAEQQNHR